MATATKLVEAFKIEAGTSIDDALQALMAYNAEVRSSGIAQPEITRLCGQAQSTYVEFITKQQEAAIAAATAKKAAGGSLNVKESQNSPGWLGVYGLNVRRPIGMYAGQWIRFLGESESQNETPIVRTVRKAALECVKAGRGVKVKEA